jgi:hypothetical protein
MDIQALAQSIYDSGIGSAVRESETLCPLVEFVHVLAASMVVGSILVVDLRMIGLAWMSRPYSRVAADVLPFTWSAFFVAVIAGSLLFASNATGFIHNPYFLAKMSLLVVAGINMLAFHFVTSRNVAAWDDAQRTPFTVRFAGALSIALWVGVIAGGRWTGFYLDQVQFGQ